MRPTISLLLILLLLRLINSQAVYPQSPPGYKSGFMKHSLKSSRNALFEKIDSLSDISPTLEIGTEYASKIVFWGRDFGLKQVGYQPHVRYKTGKGLSFGVSSNFWSAYTKPLMMSTLSIAYEMQLNSWIYSTVNYEHWIFHGEPQLEINQFQNMYGIEFIFELGWFTFEPTLYHMYGNEQTLLSDISIKGDYKLFNLFKSGRVCFQPEFIVTSSTSADLLFTDYYANLIDTARTDITINTITLSKFRVINYEIAAPLTLKFSNFEIKPAFHFIFPVKSEFEKTINPFSYFTVSLTYTGFLDHGNIRKLFQRLKNGG